VTRSILSANPDSFSADLAIGTIPRVFRLLVQ